jgi:hypothetical protein
MSRPLGHDGWITYMYGYMGAAQWMRRQWYNARAMDDFTRTIARSSTILLLDIDIASTTLRISYGVPTLV